jgi:hypothetical protein
MKQHYSAIMSPRVFSEVEIIKEFIFNHMFNLRIFLHWVNVQIICSHKESKTMFSLFHGRELSPVMEEM